MNIYDKFKKMTQDMLDEQADTIKEAFGKKTCELCGKSTMLTQDFKGMTICSTCAIKLNFDFQTYRDFYSREDIIKENEKKLLKVRKMNASQSFINKYEEILNKSLNSGLIFMLKGNGQNIYLYEDEFEIETEFVSDVMKKDFNKLMNNESALSSILSSIGASTVVGTLASGGNILTKGTKIAKNVAINQGVKLLSESAKVKTSNFPIYEGKRTYRYADFTDIKVISSEKCDSALAVFIGEESVFFMVHSGSVNHLWRMLNFVLEKLKHLKSEEKKKQAKEYKKEKMVPPSSSIADEILKFKELLDMGAITEEEYLKKKQELLNL